LPAPCTMILLDPDLDPEPTDSAPRSKPVKRSDASVSMPESLNLKLPSARALARFLSLAQAAVRLRGQVNVLLTTDAAIKALNRRFRRKNKSTDVLSFPAGPMPGARAADAAAGDLAISVETARRQGAACAHSLAMELKILILHGLLHLAGYDHENDAGRMARRERLLRGRLGLALGLIERAGALHAADSTKVPGSPTLSAKRSGKGGARGIGGRFKKRQPTARVRRAAEAKT
jgi:probable rRNA maturation factor